MILLCGVMSDRPLAAVHEALRRLGQPVAVYDQSNVLDIRMELEVSAGVRGAIYSGEQTIDLDEVSAAYFRLYDSRQVPAVRRAGQGSAEWTHAGCVDDCLWSWAELTPALVVNRPSAMAANSSKPYQVDIIGRFGFEVPETLITTDPDAVIEFHARHRQLVYKSISGVRSIVSRLASDDFTRLAGVAWCPTQFQQYIPGRDYRVHVVGEEVFACEVISKADDYRYAARQGEGVEMQPCELPLEPAERCRAMARSMELAVAGIDLRRTPEGEWYCFEVNPSPAFTYYEAALDRRIEDAMARALMAGSSTGQTPIRAASADARLFRTYSET